MLCFLEKIMLIKMQLAFALEFRENGVELSIEGIGHVEGKMNIGIYRLIDNKCNLFYFQQTQEFLFKMPFVRYYQHSKLDPVVLVQYYLCPNLEDVHSRACVIIIGIFLSSLSIWKCIQWFSNSCLAFFFKPP